MGIPANPTLNSLVLEGLAKGGEGDPSNSLISRANGWMEEIKNDIWKRIKGLKFLQITSHGVIPRGQSKYSNPADFASNLNLTLLDGMITGTAQAGSPSSITLAASETTPEGKLIGKEILVLSGSGQASLSQITSYDETTKVVGVSPNFFAAPSVGSTYLVINSEYPVLEKHVGMIQDFKSLSLGRPEYFFPIGDEDYGEFILNCPPNKQYGARLRYYASIMKLDTSGTLMSTLYLHNRNLWLNGIKWKILDENKHAEMSIARQEYFGELNKLVFADAYGIDMNNLQQKVVDY
jgi:hypothetical protein